MTAALIHSGKGRKNMTISTVKAQGLLIEPVIGYEKYYRLEPGPPSFQTRTNIGLRGTYGVTGLSGELEITQGSNRSTVLDGSVNKDIKETRSQLRLGLRSTLPLTSFFAITARAGVRGREDTSEVTASGVTTVKKSGVNVDPYAGLGLTVAFGSNFALSAGATLTQIKDENDAKDYEVQYTLSGALKFGSF
jgi:hypothetical protein